MATCEYVERRHGVAQIRFGALGLAITAALAWWLHAAGAEAAVAIRTNVVVGGAAPEQLGMALWAVGRFEGAGLNPPSVDIEFHDEGSGCGGHLGFARLGQVDICSVLVNAMSRRAILHEMGHIWLDEYLATSVRERFLELRRLREWNASSEPWQLRGYEQGAEILAWGLGERILTPSIPDNDPIQLASGFRLLTGLAQPGSY